MAIEDYKNQFDSELTDMARYGRDFIVGDQNYAYRQSHMQSKRESRGELYLSYSTQSLLDVPDQVNTNSNCKNKCRKLIQDNLYIAVTICINLLLTISGFFAFAFYSGGADKSYVAISVGYCLLMIFYLIDSILHFALLGCKFIWKSKKEIIFQSILVLYAWGAFFFVFVESLGEDSSIRQ